MYLLLFGSHHGIVCDLRTDLLLYCALVNQLRGYNHHLSNSPVRDPRMGLLLRKFYIPTIRMAKEAVLETVIMSFGDDGILRIRINEGAAIGLAQAKLQYETIRRLCGDGKTAVMVDARANYTVTKEAQEVAAQHANKRIATAVLGSSPIVKISLNLYLSIFKPTTPYKLFSTEEAAIEWLKEHIRSQN